MAVCSCWERRVLRNNWRSEWNRRFLHLNLDNFSDLDDYSVQFGFLRKSNGKFMAIDSTDFHLADFAENDFLLPKTGRLAFRADGENFLVTIHFHTKTPILCVLEGRPLLWKTNITTAAIGKKSESIVIADGREFYYKYLAFRSRLLSRLWHLYFRVPINQMRNTTH